MSSEVYLGDGLTATFFDGRMIVLSTDRINPGRTVATKHWVGLELEVFEALIQYAIKIGWLEKGQVIK